MGLHITTPHNGYAQFWALVVSFVSNRSFRVKTLVSMIAVMSFADLYLTLLYVTNTGMIEVNPVARAMMEYRSTGILVIWKAATVALSLGILLFIRKKRSAEVGAWIGCLVLGWLMVHWVGFINVVEISPSRIVQAGDLQDPAWIMIEADASSGNLMIP
jgi:hypothetical protein